MNKQELIESIKYQIIQAPEWIYYECPSCNEEHQWHYEDFLKYHNLNSGEVFDCSTTIKTECQECGFEIILSEYEVD